MNVLIFTNVLTSTKRLIENARTSHEMMNQMKHTVELAWPIQVMGVSRGAEMGASPKVEENE